MDEEKLRRQQKYEMRVGPNQRVDPTVHTPPLPLPMMPTHSPIVRNNAMQYPQNTVPYYDSRQAIPPQIAAGQTKGPSPTSRTMPRSRPPPISSQAAMTPPSQRVVSSPPVMSSPSTISSARSSQEALEESKDVQVAMQLFLNHDVKGKGRLTAEELQNLLQNDDSTHFCISAVDALINLFGASRFGTINQSEFVSLYKRVKNWRKVYVDNDINGSFTISVSEFHNSLQELGYQVPFEVSERLFDQYSEFMNSAVNGKELKFDKFVEALVWLMRLTKVFRKFDYNQEGIATIHYKDFIDETLYLGRFLPR